MSKEYLENIQALGVLAVLSVMPFGPVITSFLAEEAKIWDGPDQRLFLSLDALRFGILEYTKHNNSLIGGILYIVTGLGEAVVIAYALRENKA